MFTSSVYEQRGSGDVKTASNTSNIDVNSRAQLCAKLCALTNGHELHQHSETDEERHAGREDAADRRRQHRRARPLVDAPQEPAHKAFISFSYTRASVRTPVRNLWSWLTAAKNYSQAVPIYIQGCRKTSIVTKILRHFYQTFALVFALRSLKENNFHETIN